MALGARDAMARDQAVEVVAALTRIKPPRELDAADRPRLELDAGAIELAAQETEIEAHVVRDEDAAGEPLMQFARELGEARRLREHRVREAGERLDFRGHGDPRIHERRPFGGDLEALDLEHADFRDAVARRARAGGLEI